MTVTEEPTADPAPDPPVSHKTACIPCECNCGIEVRLGVDGVAPNELTHSFQRDRFAGTPWHKTVPARLEPVTST